MGTFELYQDQAGRYRFRLKTRAGRIIAVGEGFDTKAGAMDALTAVKREAGTAETVEIPDADLADLKCPNCGAAQRLPADARDGESDYSVAFCDGCERYWSEGN